MERWEEYYEQALKNIGMTEEELLENFKRNISLYQCLPYRDVSEECKGQYVIDGISISDAPYNQIRPEWREAAIEAMKIIKNNIDILQKYSINHVIFGVAHETIKQWDYLDTLSPTLFFVGERYCFKQELIDLMSECRIHDKIYTTIITEKDLYNEDHKKLSPHFPIIEIYNQKEN